MNKKIIYSFLVVVACFSLFLNLYKKDQSPVCFNADEAAFGYNAYSILKTGKDEYGAPFPLRLKSFGDYKMPLYSYLSIPFISAMGLTESSTRILNDLLAFLFPFAVFFLVKELFKNDSVAILSSILVATSLGLHTIARQAHEAYLAAFLITLSATFLLRVLKKPDLINSLLFSFFSLLSLFSYQSSRIFIGFFLLVLLISFFRGKKEKNTKQLTLPVILTILVLALFSITDIVYKTERVKNLLFFNNLGFSLRINELRSEGGSYLLYNKLTTGVKELTGEYLKYFSPQFLLVSGDENPRFGLIDMSLITPLEYFLFFAGLFFLFKNKEQWRFFVIGLLLVSPLAASLTWAGLSLTRSLFLLIPITLLASYGFFELYKNIKNYRLFLLLVFVVAEIFFLTYSWDLYLNHYTKRATTITAWQCGYKKLADYVQVNNTRFDQFVITRKNGQPYIFLIFYLIYPPEQYQQQARLSNPDEYGFGQVEKFDKFSFSFRFDPKQQNTAFIGYPDDFDRSRLDQNKLKKIAQGGQDIFWIYENP